MSKKELETNLGRLGLDSDSAGRLTKFMLKTDLAALLEDRLRGP